MKHTIEGLLSINDMGTNVTHSFTVPEGVGTLRFAFTHAPHHPGVGSVPHQLSMSVYGPNGARGTRHNHKDQSPIISSNWASLGFKHGKIEAGDWKVEVDVHRILPPGNVTYRIEVDWTTAETAAPSDEPLPDLPTKGRARGPGWYTGDLHGHTVHSDGDYSPAEYLAVAHERGYDFVCLTDHNTFTGVPELKQLAGDGITVIGGVELTTFYGHAVVLGLDGWIEWRIRDGETMSARATDLQNKGALYIIAHPKSEDRPFCPGCRWAYSDMLPGPARHVEIWNNGWTSRGNNDQAVQLYYQWLNTGLRMVATGGTDTHRPLPKTMRIAKNRVYALDNTQEEILAALTRGHSYVTSGPELRFQAMSSDDTLTGMGDTVSPGPLEIRCGWSDTDDVPEPLTARLISRSKEIQHWDCSGRKNVFFAMEVEAGQWFVLELRNRNGDLYALSNPIFVGRHAQDWR